MFFRKETSYQPIIDDSESAIQIVHYGAVPKTGKTMKMWFTFFLCLLLPTAVFASDNGAKIVYDGGSLQGVKAGNEVKLYIEGDKIRVKNGKEEIGAIPASAVTEISYGLDVHRRVGTAIGIGVFTFGLGAFMLLSKSKKHFIGITWDDNGKKGGLAFQADKNDYRGLLAGLEGVTGKKAVNSDAMSVKN